MISVVVPTYNERDNVPQLVERLDQVLAKRKGGYEVLVVDDDSPDRTWEVAEQLGEDYPVRSIRRTDERGLATAVLRGAREARGDVVLVMDADLQHPPAKVPELADAVEDGADVAVGSRFVEGGGTGDFGPLRRLLSHGADLIARTLFRRARGVEDIQSGFFAFRPHVVEDVDLDPQGYKILLEILVVGDYDDVVEVGYVFGEREHGESNLGFGEMFDYLHHIASLSYRSRELHRFAAFALVGAIGALINLGVLELVLGLEAPALLASAAGIEAGLLWNFSINRVWTFGDRDVTGLGQIARSLGRDHVVRSGGIAINLAVFWLLFTYAGLVSWMAQGIGIVIAFSWNFAGNTWWTWET